MAKKRIVETTINAQNAEFLCEPRQTLLEVLRDVLDLTGTKEGCTNGNCGACTVMINGRTANACLVLAAEMGGNEITTIEGIATQGKLNPVQEAFIKDGALQCGFCTPGMVMSALDLVQKNSDPSEQEVREWLEGNLCRCTGYHNIVKSILAGAQALKG